MFLFIIFIILGYVSYSDIKTRYVSHTQLFILFIVMMISRYWYPIQWGNWPVLLIIVIVGIFASYFNLVGAADTKLIAIFIVAIKPEYLILFYFLGALFILFICGVYAVAIKYRWASRQRGIPLIPAISLAGWCCIGLTII